MNSHFFPIALQNGGVTVLLVSILWVYLCIKRTNVYLLMHALYIAHNFCLVAQHAILYICMCPQNMQQLVTKQDDKSMQLIIDPFIKPHAYHNNHLSDLDSEPTFVKLCNHHTNSHVQCICSGFIIIGDFSGNFLIVHCSI